MSWVDAETKLYINEQNSKLDKEWRARDHKIRNELQNINARFEDEREKNDKRYAPSIVWKIVFAIVWLILSWVFGALLKLVILG